MLWESISDVADLEKLTVRPFDGFVFLCGGPFSDSTEKIDSARHYAVNRSKAVQHTIAGRKVILAEKLTGLLRGADFLDLLDLENHIAALASSVVIFVESPGSIAELGSFAMMKHLSPKLFVICEQDFISDEEPSFIYLGPIAEVKKHGADRVQVFPMLGERVGCDRPVSSELMDRCWEILEEELTGILKRSIPQSDFSAAELSHQMMAIVGLCSIFGALRKSELEDLLSKLGAQVRHKEISKQLRVLQGVSLIKSSVYSSETFYFPGSDSRTLGLIPKPGGAFDWVRFRMGMVDKYKSADRKKYLAIKSFYEKNGS